MRRPVEASAVVPAAPEAVYGFLSDLRNHWLLADRFVALGGLEGGPHAPTGGRVRMKGPFGLSREAKTRVLAAEPPTRDRPGMLRGVAEIGAATVGHVGWTIEQAGSGSRVTLAASVESASSLDRLLLAAGGRLWLRRTFGAAVVNLGRAVAADDAGVACASH